MLAPFPDIRQPSSVPSRVLIPKHLNFEYPAIDGWDLWTPLMRGFGTQAFTRGRVITPGTEIVDTDDTGFSPNKGNQLFEAGSGRIVIGGFDAASRNKGALLQVAETNAAPDFSAWTERGAATLTSGQADPLGGTGAYLIGNLGAQGVDDLFKVSIITGITAGDKLSAGIMINPNGKTGVLKMFNVHSAIAGNWLIDLSALSPGWHWINNDHAAVTINNEFEAVGAGIAGLHLVQNSGDCDCLVFWSNLIDSGYYEIGSPLAPTVTRTAPDLRFDNSNDVNMKPTAGSFYAAVNTVTTDGSGVTGYIFECSDGTDGLSLRVEPAGRYRFLVRSGGSTTGDVNYASGTKSIRGTIRHLCCTWEEDNFKVYVDGVSTNPDSAGAVPASLPDVINIGQDRGQANPLGGQLAQILVYPKVHTQNEVQLMRRWTERQLGLAS